MKTNRFPKSSAALQAGILLIALFGLTTLAGEVAVPVNIPTTLTANVEPGATRLELPCPLGSAEALRMDIIVPVDNASISLRDPSGTEVIGPASPLLEFLSGASAGLPGGIFMIENIASPPKGAWTLVIQFPAAPHKTVVIATLFVQTRYQVGIVTPRTKFVTGEDISFGLIVLDNGIPITGLTPQLQVTDPDGNKTSLPGADNGLGPDGLAGDGIYSAETTFQYPGSYTLSGEVAIPTGSGPELRQAKTTVTVEDPKITVSSVTTNVRIHSTGCIEAVEAIFEVYVQQAADFSFLARLRAPNGKEAVQRRLLSGATPGYQRVTLSFPVALVRTELQASGPYTLAAAQVSSISETLDLQFHGVELGQTGPIDLTDLCSAPVEIGNTLACDVDTYQGMIEFLSLHFPLTVTQPGVYSISFKVVGSQYEEIKLIGQNRYLEAGLHYVPFNLQYVDCQRADGPYSVVSVLVLGPAGSGQMSRVGETPPFSRWQFRPRKNGDLNDDGRVDTEDRNILLTFRNIAALSPGDRRDLKRDGKIDIKDAREILNILSP